MSRFLVCVSGNRRYQINAAQQQGQRVSKRGNTDINDIGMSYCRIATTMEHQTVFRIEKEKIGTLNHEVVQKTSAVYRLHFFPFPTVSCIAQPPQCHTPVILVVTHMCCSGHVCVCVKVPELHVKIFLTNCL